MNKPFADAMASYKELNQPWSSLHTKIDFPKKEDKKDTENKQTA